MGSSLSNPVSDQNQDRIKEIVQEVVGLFVKHYPFAYKDALVQKVKKEAVPPVESDKYLLSPPTPSFDLLTGMATKIGDSYKTWKLRHFVARNEADNYRVDYYEHEGGKQKGSIELCGYQPLLFTPEEAQQHSAEFGLKLAPHDPRRRTWYMRFTSSEERSAWNNILASGCFRARPPLNSDPLIAAAFKVAYRAVRWNYGYYGWYTVTATEVETLAHFVNEILDREIMPEILDAIPSGPTKASTVALVHKTLDVSVMESVNAAWAGCLSTSASMTPPLEAAARAAVLPIMEQEIAVRNSISTAINGTVNPFLSDMGRRVVRPVLDCLVTPVTEAFCANVRGVRALLQMEMDAGAFKADVLTGNIRRCSKLVSEWYVGPLEEFNRICYAMYTEGQLDQLQTHLGQGGMTKYEVYCMVLEKGRELAQCAIYTFGESVKVSDAGVAGLPAILDEITSKHLHDARVFELELLTAIVKAVLQQPTAIQVTTPCAELVAPLQATVDALPGGISDFLNLTAMLEDIVEMAVAGAIGIVVDGSLSDGAVVGKFEAMAAELGVSIAD